MKPMLRYVVVGVAVLQLWTGAAPLRAQETEGLAPAVERLAVTVDKMITLLEREAASRAEEREDRRVEVAAGILALRYRKVEQIENEVLRITREEEEQPGVIAMMKKEIEQIEDWARSQGDETSETVSGEVEAMKMRIRIEEDRSARMRERKLILENDLTGEKRRLSHVEAVLDEWLDNLE